MAIDFFQGCGVILGLALVVGGSFVEYLIIKIIYYLITIAR